ncbi:hypothetical protein AB1N83_011029 [Pleurotus pulmonarius]
MPRSQWPLDILYKVDIAGEDLESTGQKIDCYVTGIVSPTLRSIQDGRGLINPRKGSSHPRGMSGTDVVLR